MTKNIKQKTWVEYVFVVVTIVLLLESPIIQLHVFYVHNKELSSRRSTVVKKSKPRLFGSDVFCASPNDGPQCSTVVQHSSTVAVWQ